MSDKWFAMIFLRLGLLASVLFAAFWGVWQLSGHQVPAYSTLKLTENTSLTIPFSRWWAIPFAFLMVNIFAWILRVNYKFSLKLVGKKENTIFNSSLYVGNITGYIAGFIFGLKTGLDVGFTNSLVAGLIFGSAGIIAGLAIGYIAGFVFAFVFAFVLNLVINLLFLLFSSNFWKSIYNWFIAKNIA